MERPVLVNGWWKSLLEPCINMIQTGVHTIQQSGDRSYVTPEVFYVLGDALRKIKENVKSEELFEAAVGENMFNSFWQRKIEAFFGTERNQDRLSFEKDQKRLEAYSKRRVMGFK